MNRTLDEARKLISRKYLGRGGIHGVGARRDTETICIYLSATSEPDRESLFEEIKKDATPYGILEIKDPPAVML